MHAVLIWTVLERDISLDQSEQGIRVKKPIKIPEIKLMQSRYGWGDTRWCLFLLTWIHYTWYFTTWYLMHQWTFHSPQVLKHYNQSVQIFFTEAFILGARTRTWTLFLSRVKRLTNWRFKRYQRFTRICVYLLAYA